MDTYFVVRDTFFPEEDLKRNWSSFVGGSENGEEGADNAIQAAENYANHIGISIEDVSIEFRYHPAYDQYVGVHYEGLGAWCLDSETLEEALEEAYNENENLATTMEAGSGHFFANQVVSYHKVRDGRYLFEVK